MRSFTYFILIYYFVEIIETTREFLKTEEYKQFVEKEKGELLEMYKKYFKNDHEGMNDEVLRELSIISFNTYFEFLFENISGQSAEIDDNEEAIFIKLMIKNSEDEENESKEIENENFGWNDEFGSSFKELHENSLKLLEELFRNESWSLEMKFCKIYSLVEFLAKNEELSKNTYWNDYTIKFNYVSII